MNMTEIERALRELRLSGIADTLSTRVMQAQAAQQPFLETFAAMLQDELDRRRSRLMQRRFKRSGLAERLTLVDFDWRFNPKLPRSACFELHTLKFIAEGANALIIGKPGTGKSHVAKAHEKPGLTVRKPVRYGRCCVCVSVRETVHTCLLKKAPAAIHRAAKSNRPMRLELLDGVVPFHAINHSIKVGVSHNVAPS
jgi:hypothetical protein